METTRDVRVEGSPLRCPFCHGDVAPEATDWVACRSCLARHHATCWREAGACVTCSSPDSIVPPPPTVAPTVAAPAPRDAASLEDVAAVLRAATTVGALILLFLAWAFVAQLLGRSVRDPGGALLVVAVTPLFALAGGKLLGAAPGRSHRRPRS